MISVISAERERRESRDGTARTDAENGRGWERLGGVVWKEFFLIMR